MQKKTTAGDHAARTSLYNTKRFQVIMFAIHGALFLGYLTLLFWFFKDDDAAFENGVLQFYLGGVYLGLLLASALSSSFLVAQVEVAFAVLAIILSIVGTIRDLNTIRELWISSFNVLWTVGLILSMVATVMHYTALKKLREIMRATYGVADAEQIVYGRLQADISTTTRENNESLQDLLNDSQRRQQREAEDFGFIASNVQGSQPSMNLVYTNRTRFA